MVYRAAVFDLDGTLLNTLADLADSGNELLASYGMAPHPEPAFRYFVGNGSRKLMERILPGKSPEQIDEEVKKHLDIMAPGGGYLFTTGYSLEDAPEENVEALLEAVWKYGKY